LAERILDTDWMGIQLVGFFDDNSELTGKNMMGAPILGTGDDVCALVQRERIDKVYLALPMHAEKRMREVFDALQDCTASVYLAPDLFIFELMGAREQDVAGIPVFSLCDSPFTGPFGMVKRLEDIVCWHP